MDEPKELTRHELGELNDTMTGHVPMASFEPATRVPPPFPLHTYLVLKYEP
jgi:hypothetical protein